MCWRAGGRDGHLFLVRQRLRRAVFETRAEIGRVQTRAEIVGVNVRHAVRGGRGPARGWRFVARLLVVVLAGVVAFAPGLVGTEVAMAGSRFSRAVSSERVHSGQGREKSPSEEERVGRGFAPGDSAPVNKARTGLRARWRTWRETRGQRRVAEVTEALSKPGPVTVLVKESWWLVPSRWARWWLVSKDVYGWVSITRKQGLFGGSSEQMVARHLTLDKVGKELARWFSFTGKVRVESQSERFAPVITPLKRKDTASLGFTVTLRGKPATAGNVRFPQWRVFKERSGGFTLAPLDDLHQLQNPMGRNLSAAELIAWLAAHFDVGSVLTVDRLATSLPTLEQPQAIEWKWRLGLEDIARKLGPLTPSWPRGQFSPGVVDKKVPLEEVLARGPGTKVEIVATVGAPAALVPGEIPKGGSGDANGPEYQLVGGFERWEIENRGDNKIRVTAVDRHEIPAIEGRLDSAEVRRWWDELSFHVRYAHQPDTGQGDSSRIERVFPRLAGRIPVTISSPPSPYPLKFRRPETVYSAETGGVLMPADVEPTPEMDMVIRDRRAQNKPINLRELVGGVDLERVYGKPFRDTPVSKLAQEADTTTGVGKATGAGVLGMARLQPGPDVEAEPGGLVTVAAVNGQLVFYDRAGNLYHYARALLHGHTTVRFLPTTGELPYLGWPRSLAELPMHTTHAWAFISHFADYAGWALHFRIAVDLAGQLRPGQAIDIITFKDYGLSNRGPELLPVVSRITRTSDQGRNGSYLINYKSSIPHDRESEERSPTLTDVKQFLRNKYSTILADMFVRRVDNVNTPLPGVETVNVEGNVRELINPFRVWKLWEPSPPGQVGGAG